MALQTRYPLERDPELLKACKSSSPTKESVYRIKIDKTQLRPVLSATEALVTNKTLRQQRRKRVFEW